MPRRKVNRPSGIISNPEEIEALRPSVETLVAHWPASVFRNLPLDQQGEVVETLMRGMRFAYPGVPPSVAANADFREAWRAGIVVKAVCVAFQQVGKKPIMSQNIEESSAQLMAQELLRLIGPYDYGNLYHQMQRARHITW